MPRPRLLLPMLALAAGCVLAPPHELDPKPLEPGRLPKADVAVRIPQLGPCTDSADRTLRFNADAPVTVLVHGCNGSAGLEIVGYKDVAPRKLLDILQREDMLARTPPERRAALERLLSILY